MERAAGSPSRTWRMKAGDQLLPEEFFVALYAFESQESGDLGFDAGDLVKVVKKEGEWWTGDISGRVGVFPSNYVREAEVHEIVSIAPVLRCV